MRTHFTTQSRFQDRAGRFAVGTMWLLVYLSLYACDAPGADRRRVEDRRPEPTALEPEAAEPRLVPVTHVPSPDEAVEPTSPVSFGESERAFREGRFEEAVELFERYTNETPDDIWGHYMVGLTATRLGDLQRAESAFEAVLERDPNHVKSLHNLGRVYLKSERPELALQTIDVSLELADSGGGHRLRGLALFDLGRIEESAESYRLAVVLNDMDAWSMNNLGLLYIRESRFDEALPPLARAAELRPHVAVFQNNLGIALERTGYLRSASNAYKAALDLDDRYEKASVSLARVEGRPDEHFEADLQALARSFVDQIESWREQSREVASTTEPIADDTTKVVSVTRVAVRVEPDSVLAADSTVVKPDSGGSRR